MEFIYFCYYFLAFILIAAAIIFIFLIGYNIICAIIDYINDYRKDDFH